MKIAIFSDTFYPEINGVVTFLINLAENQDNEFIFFVPKYPKKMYGKPWKEKRFKNVKILRYRSMPLTSNPTSRIALTIGRRMKKEVEKFKPDLIHIQTVGPIGLIGERIANKMKIPSINTYHTYYPDFIRYVSPIKMLKLDKVFDYVITRPVKKGFGLLHFFKRRNSDEELLNSIDEEYEKSSLTTKITHLGKPIKAIATSPKKAMDKFENFMGWEVTRIFYNRSDIITTPSEYMKRALEEHGITRPVIFISNGIELNQFEPKERNLGERIVLLHVGRLAPEKNIPVIIKMMKLLKNEKKNYVLRIVGDGPERTKLESMSRGLNIIFEGAKPRSELVKYYQEANLFVTASTIETQGIVVLEAFATGMPVIGANALALEDLIVNGKNGFKAKPNDPKDFANKVKKIASNEKRYKEMCKNARKTAEKHDVFKSIDKFNELYHEVSEFYSIIGEYAK